MKPAAIAILCVWIGQSSQSLAAPPLDEILKYLEQQNQAIGVVKTKGNTHYYVWDDTSASWKIDPATSSFTCVVENKPNGRYVLDQNPWLSRWTDGSAPCCATWQTDFRDSRGLMTQWERSFQHHNCTNFISSPFDLNEAQVSKKSAFFLALAERAEKSFSGLGYTGLGAMKNLPIYSPSLAKEIVVSDSGNGKLRVHYWLAELCAAFDVILDPAKNYALDRYSYSHSRGLTTSDNEFSMTYEVLDHRQIADGIWYPIHFTMTIRHSKEYVTQIHALYPSRADDDYRPTKSEVVLTNASILHGADAEVNLTVVLPEGVDIRDLDKE